MPNQNKPKIISFSRSTTAVALIMTVAFFTFLIISKPEFVLTHKLLVEAKNENVNPQIVAENIAGIVETKYFLTQTAGNNSKSLVLTKASRVKGSIIEVKLFGNRSLLENYIDYSADKLLRPVQNVYQFSNFAELRTLDTPTLTQSFRNWPILALFSIVFGVAFSQAIYNFLSYFKERKRSEVKKNRFNFSGKSAFDWKQLYEKKSSDDLKGQPAFGFNFEKNNFIEKTAQAKSIVHENKNEELVGVVNEAKNAKILEISDVDVYENMPNRETKHSAVHQEFFSPTSIFKDHKIEALFGSKSKKAHAPENLPVMDNEIQTLELDRKIDLDLSEVNVQNGKEKPTQADIEEAQQKDLELQYKDKLNRLLSGENFDEE